MDVVKLYLDDAGAKIVRKLSTQNGDFDVIAGMSFQLQVRPMWSDTLIVDAAMAVDEATDELTYTTGQGVFTEGIYRAWVLADFGSGRVLSTDEFEVYVFAHAPGEGTRVGAVWRAARALEPVAWDALRSYPDYGDVELQRVIELAKLRVLPITVAAADEDALDLRVVDYIAKMALVDNVLYAAISFWTNQTVTQSARGNTEEVVAYPDRIRAAESAMLRYRDDLGRQMPEVEKILGGVATQYDAPTVNTPGMMLTPGLDEYSPMPISVPYRRRGVRW